MENKIKIFLYNTKMVRILAVILMSFTLSSCFLIPPEIMNAWMGDEACTKLTDVFTPEKCVGGNCMNKLTVPEIDPVTGKMKPKEDQVGITTWIVNKIDGILADAREGLYKTIAGNAEFLRIMRYSLALVVMFYGAALALGVANAAPYAVFTTVVKMLLVYHFATNWDLFNNVFINIFEKDIVNNLSSVMSGVFSPDKTVDDTFHAVDDTITVFFGWHMMKLIMALLLTGIEGWIFALIFFFVILIYLYAIMKGVKVFILAMIARTLLYATAPIFIIFALFQQTRSLFDGWLEQVINFSMQPIFLFAFLGMFNAIIIGFFGAILEMDTQVICYDVLIPLGFWNIWWWRIGDGTNGSPIISGQYADIPLNFWAILALMIVTYLMSKMVDWVVSIAMRLSSGFVTVAGTSIPGWKQAKERGMQGISAGMGAGRGTVFGARDSAGVKRGGIIEAAKAAAGKKGRAPIGRSNSPVAGLQKGGAKQRSALGEILLGGKTGAQSGWKRGETETTKKDPYSKGKNVHEGKTSKDEE